jgi:putative transposase
LLILLSSTMPISVAGGRAVHPINWHKKYGGLKPSEKRRLKQLDEENARLKKLVADLSLDKDMLQDVIRRKIRGLSGSGRWSITSEVPGR